MMALAPESLLAAAKRHSAAGQIDLAIVAYRQLLTQRPELTNSWYNLAMLETRARRYEEALGAYACALDLGIDRPEEVHLQRAIILSDHLGRSDEALTELRTAVALARDYLPALLNLGNALEDRGDRDGARKTYSRALEVAPDNPLALARLAGVTDLASADDALIARLRAAIAAPTASDLDRADLGFALGRALDAAKAYDAAFQAYRDANLASRTIAVAEGVRYDRAAQESLIDQLIAAFPTSVSPLGNKDNQGPLFITGMFRSGSTLAEQILSRHSGFSAGGELEVLPALVQAMLMPYPKSLASLAPEHLAAVRDRYLASIGNRAPSDGRLIDKRPDNVLHIGLIKTLFPDARIIHTRRQPIDNRLSVWFLHVDPTVAYATDLGDIAHFLCQERRLVAHWHALYGDDVIELDYDQVVADPQETLTILVDRLGLAWENELLLFYKATNAVRTASNWQVRQPLYQASSGRWRHYQAHLGDVIDSLSACPWVTL